MASGNTRGKKEHDNTSLLTAILDNVLDGIITIDERGKVASFNKSAEKIFGYPAAEVIGNNVNMLMPEPYHSHHDGYLHNFTSTGKKKIIGIGREVSGLRKDGSIFPMDLAVSEMWIGEQRMFTGIVRDISERMKAIQVKLEDEARLNEAQRIAHVGSWDLNLLTGELVWSDEIFRLFEIDKAKFGATYEAFLNAIHPDDRDAVNQAYTNSLQTQTPYEITHRLLMNDGRIKWVQERCTSDFDANGKPLRSRGTVQDISELRMAEYAAQESATRTQTILDNVLDGIITISERGIVESFNKSAEKIFGYSAAEVIGNNVKMLMPDPYQSQHDGYLHNYISTGVKKIIGIGRQVEGKRKDGSTFPMDLAVSEMRLGEKRMFTGVVRDITERVKIERMKSEFISTVSHELRTPLTSIRGSLGLIAGGIAGELPAQAKALLDIAHKNSELLILLVNDILDMEKIEAGKMEFQTAPIKLMSLIKQSLEANRSYADQYRVTYRLEDEMPEVMVHVDANRMLQVLANLLSNAAKFSPMDSEVTVNTILDGERVRVNISDRGSGISEEFRSQIFQKFAQADSSDTRKKGGTGLGLSITKAIVEQMGGRIGFDSTPDVMTTFFIEFPVWHETTLPVIHSDNSNKQKVLIVEDDLDVAILLQLMLEKAGIASDIANDAAQAKNLLSRDRYAAMTLDLALPDQDGISLIRELRSRRETEKLPIVVVSVKAVEGRKELNGDAFTVLNWISKPINQSQLVSSLQQVLETVSAGRSKVLHIEDDPDIYSVVHAIVGEFADLDNARNLADARRMLDSTRYDLVILDLSLPDGMGTELLPYLNAASPPVPVLVFSAQELGQDEVKKVQSALVKSRTDNGQLLDIIKKLIRA